MKRLHISFNGEKTTVVVDKSFIRLAGYQAGARTGNAGSMAGGMGLATGTLAAEGGHYRQPVDAGQSRGAFAESYAQIWCMR